MIVHIVKPALSTAVMPFYAGIHGGFWFILKVSAYLYFFMWLRFTLPRYRFDQLMRLGWHFLIPLSIINVLLIGIGMIAGTYLHLSGWWLLLTTIPASVIALIIALFILATEQKDAQQPAKDAAPDPYA